MPFNGETNIFERIWSFFDRFTTSEAVRRTDLDTAFNDVTAGINDTSTYLQQVITDTFENGTLYLGESDVAPTVNSDGDPLVDGNTYINNLHGALYYYKNSAWTLAIGGPLPTSFIKTLLVAVDAATARGVLGLGTAATINTDSLLPASGGTSTGTLTVKNAGGQDSVLGVAGNIKCALLEILGDNPEIHFRSGLGVKSSEITFEDATDTFIFSIFDVTGQTGQVAARIDDVGPTMTSDASIVTREKGDARYYRIASSLADEIGEVIAGMDKEHIGGYIFARKDSGNEGFGDLTAGSNLRPTGAAQNLNPGSGGWQESVKLDDTNGVNGTWMCLGVYDYEASSTGGNETVRGATLWKRIA